MGETVKILVWRALGIAGGAAVALVLAGFAMGYCARAVHGQAKEGAASSAPTNALQIWKCSVDVAVKDEHGKISYHAHGWLELRDKPESGKPESGKDGAAQKLHKQLVAVRTSKREALHDCADYLADKVEVKAKEKREGE